MCKTVRHAGGAESTKKFVRKGQHICAVNACIRFNQLNSLFPDLSCSIVIPSVTGEVNKSVTLAAFNQQSTEKEIACIKTLMDSFSSVTIIPENELGICTDLTSCMPGFIASIFSIIVEEALSRSNLSKEEIHNMIITTILGTSKLCVDQKMPFDQIVERVATKGGITEEGTKSHPVRLSSDSKNAIPAHQGEKRKNDVELGRLF